MKLIRWNAVCARRADVPRRWLGSVAGLLLLVSALCAPADGEQTLQEQVIKLVPGTTLVFYTDGFTEAMNSKLEEFGEEAFLQTITQNQHLSAEN